MLAKLTTEGLAFVLSLLPEDVLAFLYELLLHILLAIRMGERVGSWSRFKPRLQEHLSGKREGVMHLRITITVC